ncbi:uncharacterized protein MELLADRAFT_102328 [Melampsora larici-populina 98AG31]|uniref:Uncharacterized protein n=1 Tax=Melampsora larici-populina (strain 98AG31 / pathotype 3-4-7) TaxID=747676 RepID=F4R7X9_MELLP|nr:uncharacterized protein MELLADRAFT_102328 [Melampsora larici-populina 98AG31]EGG11712.1 hypothetical protein MELLADRAFT_102328 [Melampsora larici-populina 98AG31]
MNRPKTMKPQVETRTVTTDGTFEGFAEFLRSDNPADLVETELNYEHTLTDPRCDPEENEYETDGPHEFRLKKRKTTTVMETSPMGQPSSVGGEEQVVEDLVIHLSDSVREMFAGWTMSWKFAIDGYNGNGRESISDTPEGSRIFKQSVITPYSDPAEWKTITVGKVMEMRTLLAGYADHDDLEFNITWSRQEPSFSQLERTQRELDLLKRAMAQTQAMLLGIFNRPSIDITRLVFRSKTQRNSQISVLITEDVEPRKGRITSRSSLYNLQSIIHDVKLICYNRMPRSKQPFMSQAHHLICHVQSRALYFAPLRSTYQVYCKALSSPAEENDQLPPLPLWPVWAEAYCTPYTIVPGFKTPSSPKSLYRLADMLIIPQLKAICRQQISNSIHVQNVISELQSSVFEQHEELRVDAYKFMRNTWHLYQSSEIVPFLANMSEAEAALVFNHILKNLPVSNSLLQPV